MVEFVIGRNSADKANYFLNKTEREIKDNILAPVLFLVSPQATFITENMLIDSLGKKGIMGVQVMGPEKLTEIICAQAGGRAKKIIDSNGRGMIIKRIMEENAGEIPALRKCLKVKNIYSDIESVISECKTLDISSERLFLFAQEKQNDKIKDIAFLYKKFDELLKNKGLTNADRTNIAIENIKNCDFIKNASVFVYDFDLLTNQMARYVAQICKYAKSTAISFGGSENDQGNIFELQKIMQKKIEKYSGVKCKRVYVEEREKKSDDILNIRENIFSDNPKRCKNGGDVKIFSAQNRREELMQCREIIARLVAEGAKYSDIAVLCPDVKSVLPTLKRLFDESGIPFFADEKRSLFNSTLGEFMCTALECCRGRLKKNDIMRHLKCGLCGDEDKISVLHDYMLEHISSGYAFFNEFSDEEAEQARREIVLPFEEFIKSVKKSKTAEEILNCLEGYMVEKNTEENLKEYSARLKDMGLMQEAGYYSQVYEGICDIITQLKSILGDTVVSVREIADIIRSGMENGEISIIPMCTDEVSVQSVSSFRLPKTKAVIIIDMNEGEIPDYSEKSDVLTSAERKQLLEEVCDIKEAGAVQRQKYAVYKALTAGEEKLFLLYKKSDGNGEKVQPSVLIDEIKNICSATEESVLYTLRENLLECAKEGITEISEGKAVKNTEYFEALKANDKTREKLLYFKNINEYRDIPQILPHTAEELYEFKAGSVTRYESFYGCPFKHFLRYGLNPRIYNENTFQSFDIGNFFHNSIDIFCRDIKSKNLNWKNLREDEIKEFINKATEKYIQENMRVSATPENEFVLQALKDELEKTALVLTSYLKHGEGDFYESEHSFFENIGGEKITGSIDRIDTARVMDRDYFRIIDYKSGSAKHDFELDEFVTGKSLQLMVYVIVAQRLFADKKDVAGANYFMINIPELKEGESLEGSKKMTGFTCDDINVVKAFYGIDEKNKSFSSKVEFKGKDKKIDFSARGIKKVYSKEEIKIMEEYTHKIIGQAVLKIKNGEISRNNCAESCKYCNYKDICLLEKEEYEQLKKETIEREQAFKIMLGAEE